MKALPQLSLRRCSARNAASSARRCCKRLTLRANSAAWLAGSARHRSCISVRYSARLGRLPDRRYAVAAGTRPRGPILVPGLQHRPGECELSHVSTVGALVKLSAVREFIRSPAYPCGSPQPKLMRACLAPRLRRDGRRHSRRSQWRASLRATLRTT